MFIDLAYIIRENCNLDDNDRIISYILLPEPFIGKPGTKNVIPNSYAAFKELDYLMNYHEGTTDYNIVFDYGETLGQDKFKIKSNPYNFIYVVSNENIDGIMYTSLDTILEFIGYALFVTTGAVGDAADSIWDNLSGMLQHQFVMDDHSEVKFGNFLCFGISELFYNGRKAAKHAVNEVALNLMSAILKNTDQDISANVTNYIQSKKLNEAGPTNNEVIDRILQIQQYPIEEIEPEGNVIENVKTIKNNYISKIINERSDIASQNCDEFMALINEDLDKYIENQLHNNDGLDFSLKFLGKFEIYLNSVKSEMDVEINDFTEKIKQIKNYYKSSLDDIKVGQEKFLPWIRKQRVKEACEAYLNYARQESDYQQEIIKRKEAKRFFANILSKISGLKTNLNVIKSSLKTLYNDISQEVSNIKNAKIISKAYSIDLSNDIIANMKIPKVNFSNFIDYLKNQNITLKTWYNFNTEKQINYIYDFAQNLEIIKTYEHRTIEDVMMELDDTSRKEIVKKLDEMSSPLCPYKKGYVGDINTLHIIGVENENNTILKDSNLDLLSQINYTYTPTFSSTNDPYRWLIFKTEASLPGYALKDFYKYKSIYDYRVKQSNKSRSGAQMISFHIYEGWENFPELIPEIQDENALKLWSLGYSDSFKVIKRQRGKYWIYTQVGDEVVNPKHDGWEKISDSQDRIKNFEIFQSNEDFINVISHLIDTKISEKGEKIVIDELKDYLNRLDAEVKKATTHEMSKQLAKESREIKEYIKELSAKY